MDSTWFVTSNSRLVLIMDVAVFPTSTGAGQIIGARTKTVCLVAPYGCPNANDNFFKPVEPLFDALPSQPSPSFWTIHDGLVAVACQLRP